MGIKGERGEDGGKGERAKIKCFDSRKKFPLWTRGKLWRQEQYSRFMYRLSVSL